MINDAKPFVKWAGGKARLFSDIDKIISKDIYKYDTYIEPFVGGGAVLFNILKKYPNIKKVYINDINEKLITTYRIIRDCPVQLISKLKQIENEYLPKNYEGRTDIFLNLRTKFNRSNISDIERSALFIFLNRTCFNGLYRENSKGEFNVPHGKYINPSICDERTIYADSEALANTELLTGDFMGTLKFASETALYYLDPPYKPIDGKKAFSGYDKSKFGDDEQTRLKNFCDKINDSCATFILSSSDMKNTDINNSFFDDLYSDYSITRVKSIRSINSDPKKRGKINELLITNKI